MATGAAAWATAARTGATTVSGTHEGGLPEPGNRFARSHARLPAEPGNRSDTLTAAPSASLRAAAPHMWQLGWLDPQLIDGTSLLAGTTISLSVPAQTRSSASGVKINPTWVSGASPIYLGYRLAEGMDASLSTTYSNKVNVYLFNGANNYDAQLSYWLAGVGAGKRYTEVGSLACDGCLCHMSWLPAVSGWRAGTRRACKRMGHDLSMPRLPCCPRTPGPHSCGGATSGGCSA